MLIFLRRLYKTLFQFNKMQLDQTYLPTVLWSQREDTLKLVVKIQECGPPKIELDKFDIKFSATTKDQSKKYAFELKLFEAIETEGMIHKVTPQEVIIHLTKFGLRFFWPRLCDAKKKPHFVKLDFDSWMSESDFEEEKQKKEMDKKIREQEVEEVKQDLHRRSVLFIYNFIQLLMFVLIFLNCSWGILQNGVKFNAYKTCGKAVEYAVCMSGMETLLVWGGLTKGKVKTSFFQWIARSFTVLCLYLAHDVIGSQFYVAVVFFAWSLIDIFRYSFYILSVLTLELKSITWLRYTLWIPLYPTGLVGELCICANAAMHFYNANKYMLKIGGISFGIPHIIAIYCLLVPYGFFTLYTYMWRARALKYGSRRKFKAN